MVSYHESFTLGAAGELRVKGIAVGRSGAATVDLETVLSGHDGWLAQLRWQHCTTGQY